MTGGFHKWLYPIAGWFNITGDIPWLINPIGYWYPIYGLYLVTGIQWFP
jgi:hypothetical protein